MRNIPGFRLRNLVLAAALAASAAGFAATFSGWLSPALCRTAIAGIQFYQQKLHPYTHPFVRCRLQPTCSAFALHKFKSGRFSQSVVAVAERLEECARTPAAARPLAPRVPLAVIAAAGFQRDNQDAAAGAACCAGFGGLMVFFIVFFVGLIVLSICLLIWVAKDAKSRGVDNPVIWMILVFCTGLLGLIIYLATRPGGNLVKCEHCPNKKLQYSVICPHCGHPDSRVPALP